MPIIRKNNKTIAEQRDKDVMAGDISELRQIIEEQKSLIQALIKKEGYTLEKIMDTDAGSEIYELVKDNSPIPSGSYTNPTPWESGMSIEAGDDDYINTGWYVYDGLPQRCILDGNPDRFDDPIYWEVM